MNRNAMLVRLFRLLFIGLVIAFLGLNAYSHDGLDPYGCHYSENRENYHCHRGEFSGLSFESKAEMLRQLNLQNANRGRLAPHQLIEQDITSPYIEPKEDPVTDAREETKKPEKSEESSLQQTPPEKKRKEQPTAAKETQQPASKSTKARQQQSVRVESIKSDGTVIYEDLRGQRFYLDDNGNKVQLRGKR
jgi:hypothetical protein